MPRYIVRKISSCGTSTCILVVYFSIHRSDVYTVVIYVMLSYLLMDTVVLLFTGSIMAVTSADPHSPDKTNRFVGICIQRAEYCLRANFTLRNVIDGQGMPVQIYMLIIIIIIIIIIKSSIF